MKRTITFLLAILFSTSFAFSQAVDAGTKLINLDVGFVTSFNQGKIDVPPITVAFDYILSQVGPGYVGLGAMAGYATSKEESRINQGFYYQHTFILLGARGTYHWFPGQSEKFDTYAGLTIGYSIASSKSITANTGTVIKQPSGMIGGMFAGIRYFFIPNLGVNAEFSYGVSAINIGASLKF
jgi:hypothetical protein